MTPVQDIARAVFEAGLPRGEKGDLIPGHTTWEMLGPKAQARYERMAAVAINTWQIGLI